jgi:hypothetical protein
MARAIGPGARVVPQLCGACCSDHMRITWGLAQILFLIAVICFALEVVGLDVKINLIALGLAFGFAGFLVGNQGVRVP